MGPPRGNRNGAKRLGSDVYVREPVDTELEEWRRLPFPKCFAFVLDDWRPWGSEAKYREAYQRFRHFVIYETGQYDGESFNAPVPRSVLMLERNPAIVGAAVECALADLLDEAERTRGDVHVTEKYRTRRLAEIDAEIAWIERSFELWYEPDVAGDSRESPANSKTEEAVTP